MSFESRLGNSMPSGNAEKTFVDKVLSRQDAERMRNLIKKPKLKREELLELLYLMSGIESKLLNLGAWDRYIICKFFVWIREFIKITELIFDYRDDLEKKKEFSINPRTKQLFENVERNMEHSAKFLIDLFLLISRTTLSLGATGFLEILKQKYEVAYSGNMPNMPDIQKPDRRLGGLIK